jgi:hypothetical protein
MDMGTVAEVSPVRAASIFSAEFCMLVSFMHPEHVLREQWAL